MSNSEKDSVWFQILGIGILTVIAVILIKAFAKKEERFNCPNCKIDIKSDESPCHNCSIELNWPNKPTVNGNR